MMRGGIGCRKRQMRQEYGTGGAKRTQKEIASEHEKSSCSGN
jgi:hypothetical protein